MQRKPRKPEFGNYKDSPLAHLLMALSTRITHLKAVYKNTEKSMEKAHTEMQIDLIESMLKTLHTKVLPEFDHGNAKPSLIKIALSAIPYKSSIEKLYTREWILWEALKKFLSSHRNKTQDIHSLIDSKKADLFADAANIPGADLEETLAYIKQKITDHALFANMKDADKFQADCETLFGELFDYGKPYGFYSANVHHAMMYDLVVEAAIQFMALPRSVGDLVPFINPEAASINVSSGALGALVSMFTDETVNLQNVPSSVEGKASYKFELTRTKKSKEGLSVSEPEYYDGAEYYSAYNQFAMSELLRQIRTFHERNPDDKNVSDQYKRFMSAAKTFYTGQSRCVDVENEVKRTKFLLTFIERQQELITGNVDVLLGRKEEGNDFNAGNNLATIAKLDAEIATENDRKLYDERLSKVLVNIQEKLFKSFLKTDPELKERMAGEKKGGANVDYADSPIPSDVIDVNESNGELSIVPIRSRYIEMVRSEKTKLNYNPERTNGLKAKRDQVMQAWTDEKTQQFNKMAKDFVDVDLQKLVVSLRDIAKDEVQVKSIHDKAECENALARIEAIKRNLEAIRATSETILVRAREQIKLSDEEVKIDTTHEVSRWASDAIETVRDSINSFSDEINQVIKKIDDNHRHIFSNLQKLEEDAAYQESMRNQGPDKIKQLIAEETLELNTTKATIDRLENSIDSQSEKLASDELSLMKARDSALATADEKLQGLCAEVPPLMEAARLVLKNDRLPHFQDDDEFNEWLAQCIKSNTDEKAQISLVLTSSTSKEKINNNRLLDNILLILNSDDKPRKKLKRLKKHELMQAASGQLLPLFKILGYKGNELPYVQSKSISKEKNVDADLKQLKADIESVKYSNNETIKANEEKSGIRDYELTLIKLKEIKDKLDQNGMNKSAQQCAKIAARQKYEDEIRKLEPNREAIANLRAELPDANIRLSQKIDSISVLNLRLYLLDNIEPFREAISRFENNSNKFSNDKNLYQELHELNKQQQSFMDRVGAIKDSLIIKDAASPLLKAAHSMLNATSQRIRLSVEDKFSDEIALINEYSEKINSYAANTAEISINAGPYEDAEKLIVEFHRLNERLTAAKNISQPDDNSGAYHDVISEQQAILKSALDKLSDTVREKIKITYAAQTAMVDKMREQCQSIAGKYAELTNVQDQTLFKPETLIALETLQTQADGVYQSACELDADQDKIAKNMAHIPECGINEVAPTAKNDVLGLQCQLSRTKLILEYPALLDAYLEQRAGKFYRKDKVTSSDKVMRINYVCSLKQTLTAYAFDGDLQKVTKVLDQGIAQFKGIHLQALLNKIKIELLDQSRLYEELGKQVLGQAESLEVLHNRAGVLLGDIESQKNRKHASFIVSIQAMYDGIDALRAQANALPPPKPTRETRADALKPKHNKISLADAQKADHQRDVDALVQLADNLQADVDRYLLSNPLDSVNPQNHYDDFRNRFNTRLHSCDDILTKHRPIWPVVFNVIVGVLTLGIAVAACALVTKIYHGHSSLFFGNSSRLKNKTDHLSETLEEDVSFGIRRAGW